jgi:predicted ribosome quality control (RQC) complex YloA/Tae2 family protein
VIIGRHEQENAELAAHAAADSAVLEVVDYPGPVALLRGRIDDEMIKRAAEVCARYSDAPADAEVTVTVALNQKEYEVATRTPVDESIEIREMLI